MVYSIFNRNLLLKFSYRIMYNVNRTTLIIYHKNIGVNNLLSNLVKFVYNVSEKTDDLRLTFLMAYLKRISEKYKKIFWAAFSPLLAMLTVWALLKQNEKIAMSDRPHSGMRR